MNREKKYPDTRSFHYHNQNPRKRITGDCVFRAFSQALDQDYNATVMEMATLMTQTGYALNDTKGEDAYLKKKGWVKHAQPRKPDGKKYTGVEFCEALNNGSVMAHNGAVIAHIGGHHAVCIKRESSNHWRVQDIWDSTGGCIGNYWTNNTIKED